VGAVPEVARVSEQVRAALPATKRLGGSALELTQEATPLVKELRNARVDENVRAAGKLAATLLAADVGDATRAGRALASELLRAELPRLSNELLRAELPRLTNELLRADVPRIGRLLRRSVTIQAESLRVQKEALGVIRETLAVAREAERHAESLDNKTGGSGTTVVPPP
jgi:hypothetical protein